MLNKNLIFAKYFLLFVIILFSISSLSIKNAWKKAYNLDRTIFIGLKNKLPKNSKTDNVLIVYKDSNHDLLSDLKTVSNNNHHFILYELIYMESWESKALKRVTNIDDRFNINYYYRKSDKIKKEGNYYLYNYSTKELKYIPLKTNN